MYWPTDRSHVSKADATKFPRAPSSASVAASSTSPSSRLRPMAATARRTAGRSEARTSPARTGAATGDSVAASTALDPISDRRARRVSTVTPPLAPRSALSRRARPAAVAAVITSSCSISVRSASRNGSYSIRTLPVTGLPTTLCTPGMARSRDSTLACEPLSQWTGYRIRSLPGTECASWHCTGSAFRVVTVVAEDAVGVPERRRPRQWVGAPKSDLPDRPEDQHGRDQTAETYEAARLALELLVQCADGLSDARRKGSLAVRGSWGTVASQIDQLLADAGVLDHCLGNGVRRDRVRVECNQQASRPRGAVTSLHARQPADRLHQFFAHAAGRSAKSHSPGARVDEAEGDA